MFTRIAEPPMFCTNGTAENYYQHELDSDWSVFSEYDTSKFELTLCYRITFFGSINQPMNIHRHMYTHYNTDQLL